MAPLPRPDLYISADVETDGPIPGEFSMLSFALSVAATYDGQTFCHHEDEDRLLYLELKPISQRFDPEALEVNGLDRDRLAQHGIEPAEAMRTAARWVADQADGARPVLVAYPVAFDWSFLYWYFVRFTGKSPFGFSSCLDIRTLYQARAMTVHDRSSRHSMPRWLLPKRTHTHHAADDALEQGELFANIFSWALGGGGREVGASGTEAPTPLWLLSLTAPEWQARQTPPAPSPSWPTRLLGLEGSGNGRRRPR